MYFLFQTIGAFFGAAIIFGMYYGKELLQKPLYVVTVHKKTDILSFIKSKCPPHIFNIAKKFIMFYFLLFASLQTLSLTILELLK